jgi:hypothetical protein
VVKSYSREAGKVVVKVTSRTLSGGRYVIRRQSYRPGRVKIPIMAGGAISVDTRMGKNRWNEFNSVVAKNTILDLDGRQVIKGLAGAAQSRVDQIVVAGNAVTELTDMIVDTTGKSTRGVANITIVCHRDRHVIGIPIIVDLVHHTFRDNTIVTGIAAEKRDRRGGVVDERRLESLNVMARSAIAGDTRVVKNRGIRTDRINTINHIVAFCAGL